ncbi:tyrosine-type recombinase/integrase [Vibrio mimicus]|uniref:tyrosine-type recombinase/integrase n=1 Tax=Vibrio mimicus TaxID=674 RepID=UPI002FF088E1
MKLYLEKVPRKGDNAYKIRGRQEIDGKIKNICKTFDKKEAALRYKAKLEKAKKQMVLSKAPSVANIIDMLANNPEIQDRLPKKRFTNVVKLKRYDIALVTAQNLTELHIIEFIKQRTSEGAVESTISKDICDLKMALKLANTLFDTSIPLYVIDSAKSTARTLKFVGRSVPRDRLPSLSEMVAILKAARRLSATSSVPMFAIIRFAARIGLRRGELANLKWGDYNKDKNILIIRSRKDPRHDRRYDSYIRLEDKEIKILNELQKSNEYIFWNKKETISKYFKDICNNLNIEDLHFHDLKAFASILIYKRTEDIVLTSNITGNKDLNILNNFYLRIGLISKSLLH